MAELTEGLSEGATASDRKLRLFAAACCRRIWLLLPDSWSRRAVEVAERFADGQASYEELTEAERRADLVRTAARRAARLECTAAAEAAANAAWCAVAVAHGSITDAAEAARAAAGSADEPAVQSRLLRCVFGPRPFESIPRAEPSWLTWKDGFVVKLAEEIYQQHRFADLPVLADALEEAGCGNAELLEHCRSRQEHVRGCWAVDLILSKDR